MRRYRAAIVGFKWSNKSIEKYRPIFKYTDSDGIERQYIRRRAIEKTPFTMQKRWYIYKSKNGTYEKSERKINQNFVALCLFVLSTLLVLLVNSSAPYVFGCIFVIRATLVLKRINRYFRVKRVSAKEGLQGKIIGYKKVKTKSIFANGDNRFEFHPIIEYVFCGRCYARVSRSVCKENEYDSNNKCKIYIDMKKQKVYDSFEVEMPCFNFGKIKTEIGYALMAINNALVKREKVKEFIPQQKPEMEEKHVRAALKGDTIPMNIPLKTYNINKKVSGYY